MSKQMQTDDNMIKLALDTVDLVILRWLVNQAMKRNVTVDPQQYERLTSARDLLAECNTTVVLQ
jgi:hypothetical protein